MENKAEILAQHYQHTFELTFKLWEQRNRIFLILLFVVGLGTLITFNVHQTQPILVDLVAKFLSIESPERLDELRLSFPYGLIQSILLMVILYLMVQLYHRTINIIRHYQYLAKMEEEIQTELGIQGISFTRESKFYEENSPKFAKQIGVAYIVMLGLLLIAFLSMRIYTDVLSGNIFTILGDILLALPTLRFYGVYAHVSSPVIRNALGSIKKRVPRFRRKPTQ